MGATLLTLAQMAASAKTALRLLEEIPAARQTQAHKPVMVRAMLARVGQIVAWAGRPVLTAVSVTAPLLGRATTQEAISSPVAVPAQIQEQ